MTIVKNHTGTVITKDGPQVKKTEPDRADVGRRQIRVLPQRNRAPSLCRKYAPPAAARHHQAYRGEALLNRTKRLFHRLRNISRMPAGICSCRKPKGAWRKKLRSISMSIAMLPFSMQRSNLFLMTIRVRHFLGYSLCL